MKAASFQYQISSDLVDLLLSIKQTHLNFKFLAGSQSLGPMMNLRLAQPELIFDLKGIRDLKVAKMGDDFLELGACITHAEIEDQKVPDATNGLMSFVAKNIAYRAIRNQGTLGGSLCHADPAADWVCTMIVLNAELELVSLNENGRTWKSRKISVRNFMQGPFTTVLQENEILKNIVIKKFSTEMKWGYYKICQKPGEFSKATAAVVVDPKFAIHRLVIGATDTTPLLMEDAKNLITNPDPKNLNEWLQKSLGKDPFETQLYATAAQRAIQMLKLN